mmetsp:Transcript_2750/g.11209  ORF Transcript_2750/g.11209 Transcript_2750/m.11209 type:complete len:378 (-) Transcript_2750:562-1695(-)
MPAHSGAVRSIRFMASTIAAAKSSSRPSSPLTSPPSRTMDAILQYVRSAPSSAQSVLTTVEPLRSSKSPPSLAKTVTTLRTTTSKSASSPAPRDPSTRIARVTTSSESCPSDASSSSSAPTPDASRDNRRTVSGLPSHNAAYHRKASSRVGPFAPSPACFFSAARIPGRSSPPADSISPIPRAQALAAAVVEASSSSDALAAVSLTLASVLDMHGRTAPMMDAKCGTRRGVSPASDTNSLSQLMHVTRVNSSPDPPHLPTKIPASAPRSAPRCARTPSPLISARKSPRAPSACCLISLLGSLSMFSSPSSMSGRCVSMSISGTESNAVIQPTKNCLTYGFSTPMRSLSIDANFATSNASTDSVTMSFTSLSSRCAAF